MTRETHYDGRWMPVEERDRLRSEKRRSAARSDLPCPMIMSDIEPYRSMIDGSMITSRSEHRRHLVQNGCVEMGNECPVSAPAAAPKHEIALDVKTAIEQVKAGYIPPEGPSHDEDGHPIEDPGIDIGDVVVENNGDFFRGGIESPTTPKIIY